MRADCARRARARPARSRAADLIAARDVVTPWVGVLRKQQLLALSVGKSAKFGKRGAGRWPWSKQDAAPSGELVIDLGDGGIALLRELHDTARGATDLLLLLQADTFGYGMVLDSTEEYDLLCALLDSSGDGQLDLSSLAEPSAAAVPASQLAHLKESNMLARVLLDNAATREQARARARHWLPDCARILSLRVCSLARAGAAPLAALLNTGRRARELHTARARNDRQAPQS